MVQLEDLGLETWMLCGLHMNLPSKWDRTFKT